jgi:hypothetical protein
MIRVALRRQQALFAPPQVDNRWLPAAQHRAGEWAVVGVGPVTQVDGGSVGCAPPDPGQAVEAAPGADRDDGWSGLAQHDVEAGVVASCEPQRGQPPEHAPCRDRTADRDAGATAIPSVDHSGVGEVPVGA